MNLSKEDQEFVKTYDDSKYAKPSVTADMVIFARGSCLLYTSPSPRDVEESRMPSSA